MKDKVVKYNENLNVDAKGTIFSILLYIVILITSTLLAILFTLYKEMPLNINKVRIISAIQPIVVFVLVFLFSKNMNITLKDIGITKHKFFKSFAFGILISVILFFLFDGTGNVNKIMDAYSNNLFDYIVMFLYYFIVISSFEEIVYRGFIAHYLLGKKHKTSYIITGILFSFSHIPFVCIMNDINIFTFIYIRFGALLFYALMHVIFQKIYDRYDNCIGPIIIHFTIDFFGLFL